MLTKTFPNHEELELFLECLDVVTADIVDNDDGTVTLTYHTEG